MQLRLDKAFLLELYCYLLQAERSLAFALGAPWSDFREYYQGTRLLGVRRVTRKVSELIAWNGLTSPLLSREEVGATVPLAGLFQHLLGRWTTKWIQSWSFSHHELCFLGRTLAALVLVLESERRPEQETLISLRMDLCTCRSTIEEHCVGLAELDAARWLEHFWQAPWVKPVLLAEVLGSRHAEELASEAECPNL